jgi:hypothetical protein
MTTTIRPLRLSILGIIAGVAAIPLSVLGLLFLAEKMVH